MLAGIAAKAFMIAFVIGTAHFETAGAAADAPTGTPLHYEGAYFSQFAPRTALDMIRHLPGFTLRTLDPERRGFAGAVGNVLIDGEQPSAKSQTLDDILQRIPASQVVRIEVWRGPQTAGTASGESVLANVVRTPSAGAGVWSAGFEYANRHQPRPNGYMSWAGRVGRTEYGLGARGYSLKRHLPATRWIRNGDGELVEVRKERSPREFDEQALDGELTRDLFGGTLRATGQIYRSDYEQANTLQYLSTDGGWLGDEWAPYSESKRTTELGFSFRVPWGGELTAVHTNEEFTSRADNSRRTPEGSEQSAFHQVLDSEETILRGTLERNLTTTQRLQIGSEAAINTLDADLDLREFDDGAWSATQVPNARMSVEERRAEPFVMHAWRAGAWATEARLAAEYSKLDFSGDVRQSVDLTYVKPSLQVSRTFGREHQVRMRVAREVGQLDFTEFASRVSLSDDLIDGGNPDLRPQTAWRLELALDLRFDAQMSLATRLYHDWIDDAVDLVPLNGSDSAAGNIGRGSLDGLQVNFAVPLRRFVRGGSLKADSTFQRATVTDPLTGRERPMSDFEKRNQIKAEFRQDVGVQGLAWGVKYTYESSIVRYRIDEIDRERESPSLDVYIERNVFGGAKLTLSAVSVQGSPELRTRQFFEPNRAGVLDRVEEIRMYPGQWVLVTLDGKF
jgi:outer membrane receptor protein involved in Fe transport